MESLNLAKTAAQKIEEAAAMSEPTIPLAPEEPATSNLRRSLGHRRRAAVPTFPPEDELHPEFQAGASRALASGASSALLQIPPMAPAAPSEPLMSAVNDEDAAERLLLK